MIRPGVMLRRVMTVCAQMQSGLWQSEHAPVTAQGVFLSRRMALMGAAVFLTRERAASTEGTTLFIPARMMTLEGP